MQIGLFTQSFDTGDRIPSMYERLEQAAKRQDMDADILTYNNNSGRNDITELGSYKDLFRHSTAEQYDYLYSHNSYLPNASIPLIAKLTGAELLYAPHCTGIHRLQKRWKNRAKRLYTYPFFRRAERIRCISRWEYDQYRSMGFSEEQLFYAPYGTNREEFSTISPDWDSHETFAIANARAFKNIEAQIRAVNILKDEIDDYHHHLIGGWGDGGEYRDRIERMIAERGLENVVTIHGFVSRQDMLDIMSGCQAFLHTSHFETEGLVLYETAAAGFPICTSDNPVHNQNFNRFLHPDSDHETLAGDVKDLFDTDISEKEDIAEDMRQKAKDFGIETERQRLDELFAELTNHE